MVKRYYVVTAGLETGVFYDHWINIAPLVKNQQYCVWERASSQEEAEELFEQAKLKGQVRVIDGRSSASSRSPTSPMHMQPNNSSQGISNPQHSRHTPTPRIAGSQLQEHVYDNASHYVPSHPSSGKMNSGSSSSSNAYKISVRSASVISRAHSEPSQQVHGSIRRPFLDASRPGAEISHKNNGNRIRATLVDSPTWLASYPDDEDEAFLTPPLSPITSPVISSRLLGPTKSEPASTFSAPFSFADAATGVPASDSGSSPHRFRSSNPIKQSASFSFGPSTQGNADMRTNMSRGGTAVERIQRQRMNPVAPQTQSRRVDSSGLRAQEVNDPLVELVTRVDRLARNLRIHLASPSTQSDGDLLYEGTQQYADDNTRPSVIGKAPARGGGNAGVGRMMSPRSGKTSAVQAPLNGSTSPLTSKSTGRDVHSNSILFNDNHNSSSPAPWTSPCRHCHGTGYDAGDCSILDRTGLMQPSLAPSHLHDSSQDPRSPFCNTRKSGAPVSGNSATSFGRPSPMIKPEMISSARASPLLISQTRSAT